MREIFYREIVFSKKMFLLKKFIEKKKRKHYSFIKVYYVYLQTLYKALVIVHSSHVRPYHDIPWS